MKLNFVKSIERFRIKSLPVLFSLLLSPVAAMATDPAYSNSGTITGIPPNVDATNFYNSGTWNIVTAAPYETQHTLNYTNTGNGTSSGSMIGSVGWEFDYGPLTSGGRGLSASFFNDNQAVIQANDGTVAYLSGYYDNLVSYLLVSATNIVNKGTLIAGANGEIVLTGMNMTLARSGLEIAGVQGQGNIISSNNFTPDIAIYDEYWLEGTNLTVNEAAASGTAVGKFTFQGVGEPCGVSNAIVQIGPLTAQVADSYTTNLNPYSVVTTNSSGNPNPPFTLYSNIVRQASFVFVSDPNITASNHFNAALVPTNYFKTVAVQFTMLSTNVVTLAVQTNTLYLVDDLASSTNRTLLTNTLINPAAECTSPTLRPGSVLVSRTDPTLTFGSVFNTGLAFGSGAPGLGPPPANFFYDSTTFSNAVTTGGSYDVYSALVDNLASQIPGTSAGANITNLPGRIRIYADNLDLTRTRMDDEGAEVTIVATNLIGSAGAAINCQNLSFNLGSTNGFLNITNLVVPVVTRLHGTVDEWSGLWTNDMYVITNNYMPVVSGGLTNWVPSSLTNIEEMDLAITVVDASNFLSEVPVTVQNLILNSTNITISDNIDDVAQSFFFGGQSLTILGNLNFSGVQDWAYTNAPTLQYFTNNGVLTIPNNAHFGDDGPTNYLTFVNNGMIFSGGQTINSVNLQINGTNETSSGPFYATCQTGQMSGAGVFSAGDIQFSANSLQLNQGDTLFAQNALDFNVTNLLSDNGDSSGNIFYCQNGFNLWIKPATGDLLGTTLTTAAFGQNEVDHHWAGVDRGATAAGFTNNEVIGDLILWQENSNFEPLFAFYGTSAANGLYVNNLDLSELTDYANEIYIDPSLTIYFVTANLNTNVDITGYPDAEHYLNGKFNGHLVWAQGIGSLSQKKVLNSQLQLTANFNVIGGIKLTQMIMPSQTNIIQASTDLTHWVPIYTNIGSYTNIGVSSIPDPNAKNYPFRFYRVVPSP